MKGFNQVFQRRRGGMEQWYCCVTPRAETLVLFLKLWVKPQTGAYRCLRQDGCCTSAGRGPQTTVGSTSWFDTFHLIPTHLHYPQNLSVNHYCVIKWVSEGEEKQNAESWRASQVDSSDLLRMIHISSHKHMFTFRHHFWEITEILLICWRTNPNPHRGPVWELIIESHSQLITHWCTNWQARSAGSATYKLDF